MSFAPNDWAATFWKSVPAVDLLPSSFSRGIHELGLTAIDIDPHMTRAAGTRPRGFRNASVQTADATVMPFPDESFDSVVSCLMLHHIVGWERAVAEVARVLRPGGIFLGYDLVRTPLASLFHHLDGSPHRLIVPGDFQAECARNGLTISLQPRLVGHAMRFVARKNTYRPT